MLDQLIINNFYSGYDYKSHISGSEFILATCQRTLILSIDNNPFPDLLKDKGHESLFGTHAYSFLLEVICGLQSKLIGENEIVSQFKAAYKDYVSRSNRSSNLLIVIEKLFKDAKEVRTDYLLGLTQKTYSSIARKHIINKHKAKSVLILGSGQLAEDLINQFKKKTNLYISGRNTDKVDGLARIHDINIIPWGYHESLLKFGFIANSIGFDGVLFNQDFFKDWSSRHPRKLFVDLGSPSAVKTTYSYDQGVMKLEDVYKEGVINETQKLNQVDKARTAMKRIAEKRQVVFTNQKKQKESFIQNLEKYAQNL